MSDHRRTADYSHLKAGDLETRTLVDNVTDHLRASILAGQFSPGERLFEAALAREFGISRGPIREALALLEGDGLVESEPRKGKFVRRLDARVIDEVYSLRGVLEPYAAELLIDNLSDAIREALKKALEPIAAAANTGDIEEIARSDLAFHRQLYELTDHSLLQRAWTDLISGSLQMLVNITTPTHQLTAPLENHERIVFAIISGDKKTTLDVLTRHVEDGWDRARSAIRRVGEQ